MHVNHRTKLMVMREISKCRIFRVLPLIEYGRWTRYSRCRRPFSLKIFLQRNHSSEENISETMAMSVWSKKGWFLVDYALGILL